MRAPESAEDDTSFAPPPTQAEVSGRMLEAVFRARLAVVTGKGGVGKTTVAAAIAKLAAKSGLRVLACEIGQEPGVPSRLGEALGGKPTLSSSEPVPIAPNLDLVLLTPADGHRAFLRDVLPLGFLADRALRAKALQRFLAAAPALQELGVLYRGLSLIKQMRRADEPRWNLLVLDAPATGHTVAFASLPEVALRIFPTGPIGRALREGADVLTDPHRTVTIVTTLPEALPVAEALELVHGLEEQNMRVEGIVANIVPDNPFLEGEQASTEEWLTRKHAEGGHAPVDVLGYRSLGRLDRARAALDKLREEAHRTLLTVRERHNEGEPLVDWVARELEGA